MTGEPLLPKLYSYDLLRILSVAILPETVRGPLSMQELDSNANGTRDNWVWKQLGTYYTVSQTVSWIYETVC